MADNFLNITGLTYFYNRIKTLFASKSEFDTLSAEVEEIIAEGGEPNTIETISKNGTNVPPDGNKNVNITVPTTVAELSDASDYALAADVPTDLSDLTNTGQDPYATEGYVDENGGKIDTIAVNNTDQPIVSKRVNITIPTKVSDITNDSGFQTASDVSTAISTALANGNDPYQTESDVAATVESAVVGALKPKGSTTFANLPALAAANLNNMYNISDSFTTTADFVEGAGVSYPAGTNVAIINVGTDQSPTYKYDALPGAIDLSAYWTSTAGQNNSLTAITTAQIDAIVAA